jgi:hypothetical protein
MPKEVSEPESIERILFVREWQEQLLYESLPPPGVVYPVDGWSFFEGWEFDPI